MPHKHSTAATPRGRRHSLTIPFSVGGEAVLGSNKRRAGSESLIYVQGYGAVDCDHPVLRAVGRPNPSPKEVQDFGLPLKVTSNALDIFFDLLFSGKTSPSLLGSDHLDVPTAFELKMLLKYFDIKSDSPVGKQLRDLITEATDQALKIDSKGKFWAYRCTARRLGYSCTPVQMKLSRDEYQEYCSALLTDLPADDAMQGSNLSIFLLEYCEFHRPQIPYPDSCLNVIKQVWATLTEDVKTKSYGQKLIRLIPWLRIALQRMDRPDEYRTIINDLRKIGLLNDQHVEAFRQLGDIKKSDLDSQSIEYFKKIKMDDDALSDAFQPKEEGSKSEVFIKPEKLGAMKTKLKNRLLLIKAVENDELFESKSLLITLALALALKDKDAMTWLLSRNSRIRTLLSNDIHTFMIGGDNMRFSAFLDRQPSNLRIQFKELQQQVNHSEKLVKASGAKISTQGMHQPEIQPTFRQVISLSANPRPQDGGLDFQNASVYIHIDSQIEILPVESRFAISALRKHVLVRDNRLWIQGPKSEQVSPKRLRLFFEALTSNKRLSNLDKADLKELSNFCEILMSTQTISMRGDLLPSTKSRYKLP